MQICGVDVRWIMGEVCCAFLIANGQLVHSQLRSFYL